MEGQLVSMGQPFKMYELLVTAIFCIPFFEWEEKVVIGGLKENSLFLAYAFFRNLFPCLTDGAAWINFSFDLMQRPGFEPTSVKLH